MTRDVHRGSVLVESVVVSRNTGVQVTGIRKQLFLKALLIAVGALAPKHEQCLGAVLGAVLHWYDRRAERHGRPVGGGGL